jgi:Holliday junction resolvase
MGVSGAGARRKGARAEVDLVRWLQANGWPYARTNLRGSAGPDVTGTPGIAWEVKARDRIDLAAFVDQAEEQRDYAGASLAVVVVRRKGRPDPAQWYAVTPLATMAELLRDAGWGSAAA